MLQDKVMGKPQGRGKLRTCGLTLLDPLQSEGFCVYSGVWSPLSIYIHTALLCIVLYVGQPIDRQIDTHLMASFPGQPGQAGNRKFKPIWILMSQEMMGGSVIS